MWYVIWTKTNTEILLRDQITRWVPSEICSECRVLTRTEQQKWKKEIVSKTKLLFPGYLFVDTNEPEKLNSLIRQINISDNHPRVIKSGDIYKPITDTEEEMLKSLAGNDGNVEISTGIIENKRLKVIDGPLKGFEQYIYKIDRYKRKAWLSMNLFGEDRKFCASLNVIKKD